MSDRRRPPAFGVLIVLLGAEFVLVGAVAVGLLIELLVDRPTSYPSAIALTVLAFAALVWLGAIIVGALRSQTWIRAAGIVWQVLQFAVGAGAITGQFANPAIGWPLVAVALVAFVLLLATPSDRAAS